jgi:hypothetical protein
MYLEHQLVLERTAGNHESFLEFVHVNPYHHYVRIFINLVDGLSDMHN